LKGQFARIPNAPALKMPDEPVKPVHALAGLVQLKIHHEAAEQVKRKCRRARSGAGIQHENLLERLSITGRCDDHAQ
jgi:hypothetical protein